MTSAAVVVLSPSLLPLLAALPAPAAAADTGGLPSGLGDVLRVFALLAAMSLLAALIMLAVLWRRLRRLRISGGGFWQTLREVPLSLVVLLDLLDFALDVFSTPIIWWLLGRLRLQALREVATVEALIPFTGPLPTMTLCWIWARLGGPEPATPGQRPSIDSEQVAPGRWRPRP